MRKILTAAVASLVGLSLATGPAAPAGSASATPPTAASSSAPTARTSSAPIGQLELYTARLSPGRVSELRSQGYDVTSVGAGRGSTAEVELVLSKTQARTLSAEGVDVKLNRDSAGRTATQAAALALQRRDRVFRSYREPGGIADELRRVAADNPDIAKLVEIGRTVQDQPILAVKVTRDARRVADGQRPAAMYVGAQHAREWITPEMNTRLLHHFVDSYGNDRELTRLINSNEYWFVPVANPDGYNYTFTKGNRLWRKNLADNNGDGRTTQLDGVDLNRNFDYKWGQDNEGSSPDIADQTYRGRSPASEPETQAMSGLLERIRPAFLVNYHSAAELLLYGVGWQVATPTPDDLVYRTLAGDSEETSAVPGYDPDISAELYTTNGDTDSYSHEVLGVLGFTPEMSTCETVSNKYDDDEWEAEDCQSGFNFPDDERLVAEEFEINLDFALDIARSADNPAEPESHLGLTAPDFQVDTFPVSRGGDQGRRGGREALDRPAADAGRGRG